MLIESVFVNSCKLKFHTEESNILLSVSNNGLVVGLDPLDFFLWVKVFPLAKHDFLTSFVLQPQMLLNASPLGEGIWGFKKAKKLYSADGTLSTYRKTPLDPKQNFATLNILG